VKSSAAHGESGGIKGMAAPVAPRPRFADHLAVVGVLLWTLLGVIPFVIHLLIGPFSTPRARRRLSRRLADPSPSPDESPPPDPAAWAGRTIFVVAGEPSGDRLAARVVEAIRRRAPGVRVRGYGGPALAAAGATLDRLIVEHAVVGVIGVIASLPYWWRLCAETLARFRDDKPDVLLTVDFPGLNLRLARWARRRGIRVVHLVAPQTWAWASWRTTRVRRAVDRLLVTFPFEAAWFRDAGIDARYVGHPLFEAPLPAPASSGTVPSAWPGGPLVELRPGSRRRDVRRQARLVLEAAREAGARVPAARFVVRLASDRARVAFDGVASRAGGLPPHVTIAVGPGPAGESIAAALTTSGTSTAELAVAQVPMVVFYRLPWPMRLVRRAVLVSPWFSMANVLAGREIVVERLVGPRDGQALGVELAALLTDSDRWTATRKALGEVRAHVAHPDVADRTARGVLEVGPEYGVG
jgi:lipid-A-disaccharide synthase